MSRGEPHAASWLLGRALIAVGMVGAVACGPEPRPAATAERPEPAAPDSAPAPETEAPAGRRTALAEPAAAPEASTSEAPPSEAPPLDGNRGQATRGGSSRCPQHAPPLGTRAHPLEPTDLERQGDRVRFTCPCCGARYVLGPSESAEPLYRCRLCGKLSRIGEAPDG